MKKQANPKARASTIFLPCKPAEGRQLTDDDARSPVHLHNVRMDTFVGGITDDLGVLPHALCHRIIHDRGKAPPLRLLKIFMIFYLAKREKTVLAQNKLRGCHIMHRMLT